MTIRDVGLLESAAARLRTRDFGIDAYENLPMKAAALLESLARNHALVDGNRRLAWHATTVLSLLNGVNLQSPSVDDGEVFVLAVAQEHLELSAIAETIADWCTPSV